MYQLIIIDDDAGTSNNLGNYFPWEENGFQVAEKFYDGYTACQYLRNHQVDLIISDIKMPIMDGIALAKWLYEQGRKEKIIFISGYKDFEYAQKAMEYDVCYYCLKPVTYQEIKKKLANVRRILEKEKEQPKEHGDLEDDSMKMKQIRKIRDYIRNNYWDVTVESLADYMKKNPAYLSRFFKDNTEQNLSTYITQVRMEQALHFLQDDEFCTVYEVGEKVGYSNPVSFSKAFQRQYGVTPTEYRNRFAAIPQKKETEL